MPTLIQDPACNDTTYLLESLLEASESATEGVAVFAFASAAGCRMLLADDAFKTFASRGSFELTIGLDAVTDSMALAAIDECVCDCPSVHVRAFVHTRSGAVFHPKFCWFAAKTGGVSITGSANLTVGGLRSNWEAYCVEQLTPVGIQHLKDAWSAWEQRHVAELLPLDDARVIERASSNDGWVFLGERTRGVEASGTGKLDVAESESQVEPVHSGNEVLVAEIPRSGNRWNQANFDLYSYEHFFGARRGTQRRMFFQHVSKTGQLAEIETRPSVAVASRNYRFELEAAAGLPYPKKGRPIGVFVRVAARTFRYMLIMPTQPGYSKAANVLRRRWKGPIGQMRRVRLTVNELKSYWPKCPLWEKRT